MTAYFLDSSAVVKRYVPETGSAWIRQLADPQAGNSLFIARITWVEVRSAFARRQRESSLTSTDRTLIVQRFRSDLNNQYQVIELDATLAETAGQMVSQYPLRAYDAVQLASTCCYSNRLSPRHHPPNCSFSRLMTACLPLPKIKGC